MSTSSVASGVYHAQINGVRIAYQAAGRGEPLVLVHGSWGSHHNWDPVVPGLSAHHRVGRASTDGGTARANGQRGRARLLRTSPTWLHWSRP